MRRRSGPMTYPVTLHPVSVGGLASGRVRAGVFPLQTGNLHPGDLLWVREGFVVETRQPFVGKLRIRYARDRNVYSVAWPRALARPVPGHRRAEGMPAECSRFTLEVHSVETIRLLSVSDDDAISCGAGAGPDGFTSPVAELECFMPFKRAADALGHAWDEVHGHGEAQNNPEVLLVRFRALSRCICRIVPGMGSGGARSL